MTTKDKIALRKLSLPELASEMSNVSKACRIMGYSRQQFYEIRRNYQTYGADGLIDRLPGARGPHPNRVPQEVEEAILAHALDHPMQGALRVAQELSLQGVQVSSGGVRGVWARPDLLTKQERLLRLEKTTAERRLELSDEQVRLLEPFSPEFRERHIETRHTGDLVAVDTFNPASACFRILTIWCSVYRLFFIGVSSQVSCQKTPISACLTKGCHYRSKNPQFAFCL